MSNLLFRPYSQSNPSEVIFGIKFSRRQRYHARNESVFVEGVHAHKAAWDDVPAIDRTGY